MDTVLTDEVAQDAGVAAAARARALADKAVLDIVLVAADSLDWAQRALVIAREIEDPVVLARALAACGFAAAYNAELAGAYFAEAIELARELDDKWRLSQILTWQASAAIAAGDPIAGRVAAEEGRDLADAIGNGADSRQCRISLGVAQAWQGELPGALTQFRAVAAEAEAAHDGILLAMSVAHQGTVLAWAGDTCAARAAAEASLKSGSELGGLAASVGYLALANAALAAGDVGDALDACAAALKHGSVLPGWAAHLLPYNALAALAGGDLIAARRYADDAVATATGWAVLMRALATRAQVAIAQGEPEQAERDAHGALAGVPESFRFVYIPDVLECLATLAGDAGSHREAARLFGAAAAIRQRMGTVRFKVWDAGHEASVAALRNALGEADFEPSWVEGAAMSTEEAIAYAKRGRGERKRPATGWPSLTPTERDVVRLVREGLGNNDIATRLFVSPRTVQSHLTHVYNKLGLTSRVQLVQEAARHA